MRMEISYLFRHKMCSQILLIPFSLLSGTHKFVKLQSVIELLTYNFLQWLNIISCERVYQCMYMDALLSDLNPHFSY